MYLNYNIDTENMPKKGNNIFNSLISLSKQDVVNNALVSRMPQNPNTNVQNTLAGQNNGWGRTN